MCLSQRYRLHAVHWEMGRDSDGRHLAPREVQHLGGDGDQGAGELEVDPEVEEVFDQVGRFAVEWEGAVCGLDAGVGEVAPVVGGEGEVEVVWRSMGGWILFVRGG